MIKLEGFNAVLYPASDGAPVIYAHMSPDEAAAAAAGLGSRAALVALECDWNRDLSPWPAPAAFKREPDFAGGADEYLAVLESRVIPAAEAALGYEPPFRVIAGYSLGGLFAVYAFWKSDRFARMASISGSLWYDGFTEFLRTSAPNGEKQFAYLSLGDRESKTRSQRMAAVGKCTDETLEIIRSLGIPAEFVSNVGGHFDGVPERILLGLTRAVEA